MRPKRESPVSSNFYQIRSREQRASNPNKLRLSIYLKLSPHPWPVSSYYFEVTT
jgi:hypothetical protein